VPFEPILFSGRIGKAGENPAQPRYCVQIVFYHNPLALAFVFNGGEVGKAIKDV